MQDSGVVISGDENNIDVDGLIWGEGGDGLSVAGDENQIDAGDILLVKGSKGAKVSLIVDALRKMGQGTQPKEGTP